MGYVEGRTEEHNKTLSKTRTGREKGWNHLEESKEKMRLGHKGKEPGNRGKRKMYRKGSRPVFVSIDEIFIKE